MSSEFAHALTCPSQGSPLFDSSHPPDKGLIITTESFTADARREAVRDGAPAIYLVDGETLCELLKQLKIGVDVRLVEEVAIDNATFEAM